MPEDTIDGSFLESNTDTGTTEAVQPSAEQPAESAQQPEQTQPPQSNIPEQYRNYTPEQWFHEWNKTNSMLGRYKQEVSTLRNQPSSPQNQPFNPAWPSPLPGNEAQGLTGQKPNQAENLNDAFLDSPVDIIRRVVSEEARNVLTENERRQQQAQLQAAQQRAAWIRRIDDDELRAIRLDEDTNYTPRHEALMRAIAETDPEVVRKVNDPNLTEKDIRDTVRLMHRKADEILSGDPERIKAFNAAQKQAAATGAPNGRAATTMQTPEQTKEEATRKALVDRGWGHIFGGTET